MKILIVGSYAPSLINFRGKLIELLVSTGHNVVVTAPNISTEVLNQLKELGAKVVDIKLERTGLNPLADLGYLKALFLLIRQEKPDKILTYTVKPNIWGAIAARLNKRSSVAMVTGLGFAFLEDNEISFEARVGRRLSRFLYSISTSLNDLVIFQNKDDRDDFIKAGCLSDSNKTRLINGSGVDLSYFQPASLPEHPVFLMIARILVSKGVREYAHAITIVLKKHPEAKFVLVGPIGEGVDAIDTNELQKWQENGLEYIGPLDDVRKAIQAARVFVLPSYREGTPRSVLEAMAMGRAIITTDAPGCRETVIDGVTGYLIAIKDAQALADQILHMIEHPMEVNKMAEKSLEYAREKYDVNLVNKAICLYLGLTVAHSGVMRPPIPI